MSPTTQAAPPMSPFMSSMPAAGLMEMPPVSNTTPLPMKAKRLGALRFGAVPLHDGDAGRAHAALRHRQQRPHLELFQLLGVEDLHLDADAPPARARGRRTRRAPARWPAR